jgi:putative glutathione S-transferase
MLHLYWDLPAFHDTTNFEHIKKHYFTSLTPINPSVGKTHIWMFDRLISIQGVVPLGPVPSILGKETIDRED